LQTMGFDTPQSLALTIIFLLLGMAGEHIAHEILHWHFIPEGGTAIFVGAVIGFIDDLSGDALDDLTSFEPFLFEYALLPFVIFGAGYSLRKRSLFENIGTILTYAFLGTLVSILIISFGIYNTYGYDIYECLMFGSLISAVDPVATLAVMSSVFDVEKRVKPPTLYSLVFGESILNDAVAIVLFETFHIFYEMENPEGFSQELPSIVWDFLKIFVMSVLYGFLFGILSALAFKLLKLNGFLIWEFTGILLFAYLSYIVASISHFSGLIAIFFCGITMSDYTWMNFSEVGKMSVHRCVLAVAYCAETMIFVYLGTSLFSFRHHYQAKMIFLTLVLCFGARFIGIFGLTPIVNLCRERKISLREQIVLWFSGLRGAIAFALSVELFHISEGEDISVDPVTGVDYAHSDEEIEASEYFVTSTLIVVMFSTYICGALSAPLINCLNIESDPDIMSLMENQASPRGALGFVTRLNQWIKKYIVRQMDESEMLFEGNLALRLDRICPAKESHNLHAYFKVFYDKNVRELTQAEQLKLVNKLSEYNRSSLTKDPIGILRSASLRRPYELTTPLIAMKGSKSDLEYERLSDPFEIGNDIVQPAETVEVKEITEKEEQEPQPTSASKQPASTSNEANLLGI